MRCFEVIGAVLVALCLTEAKLFLKKHGLPDPGVPDRRAAQPEWGWIEMKVDHFDPVDNRTWQMRYMNNSQFFKPSGPLFIFLGGEWTISSSYLQTGQMYDMARENNGYMFYTEHRFYGKSYPINDLKTSSLKYLTTDQALADIIYFIMKKKEEIPALRKGKVVVVGASYSAAMATWIRMKYPHVITAALSSSAPLVPVEDFFEYYEVINDNIKLNSVECLETIREGTAGMVNLLETPSGIDRLSAMLNTCQRIKTQEPHRSYFFNTIGEIFASLVQYAYIGQIDFECSKLLNFGGQPLDKLSSYVRAQYGRDCMGDYDEFLEQYNSTAMTTNIYRQWIYQTCTEYGYFQTTTSDNQPFGKHSLLSFPIGCAKIFLEKKLPQN